MRLESRRLFYDFKTTINIKDRHESKILNRSHSNYLTESSVYHICK